MFDYYTKTVEKYRVCMNFCEKRWKYGERMTTAYFDDYFTGDPVILAEFDTLDEALKELDKYTSYACIKDSPIGKLCESEVYFVEGVTVGYEDEEDLNGDTLESLGFWTGKEEVDDYDYDDDEDEEDDEEDF